MEQLDKVQVDAEVEIIEDVQMVAVSDPLLLFYKQVYEEGVRAV